MAWSVQFKQDTATKGVGTVTITNGDFMITDRIDTNDQNQVNTLVAEAKQSVTNEETKLSEEQAIASTIAAKLEA